MTPVLRTWVDLFAIVLVSVSTPISIAQPGNDQARAQLYVDDSRISSSLAVEPGNWLAYGGNYREQRFSPLAQINRQNIDRLGLAWFLDLNSNRAQEATPLVVDGTMYLSTAWSRVMAVDLRSGKAIWTFDPQVPGHWARRGCCDVVNRGVALYRGRVYVGSYDGRLIALDALTGELVWQVNTLVDPDRFYTITGAPRAAKGKIYIGNGGAEFGVRGYVSAYDAETGDLAWRFFTVPGDPTKPFEHPELEMAAGTWSGDYWWRYGGGGTVWNSIVYDEDFNQIYIGTGNGSPWVRAIRSPGGGDNLFLSSIVALDADTGEMKWYYQTTPGDNWDYTAVQDMSLAEMFIDGHRRKVLLQAPKNGFFYVLDRSDGKLLRAHPYSKVTWASHVDMITGRPVENVSLDYTKREQWILPGSSGAHNWQPMAVDEQAGVVFIPTQESPLIFSAADEWKQSGAYPRNAGRWNNGLEMSRLAQLFLDHGSSAPRSAGALKAFDPITGQTVWEVRQPYYWNGGVLATRGGLVFQGDAHGRVTAYDKDNGARLWEFDTHTSILAPPVTFMLDGVQHVAVLTGGGGADLFGGLNDTASAKYGNHGRLVLFKLGGNAELPEPALLARVIPERGIVTATDAEIGAGEGLYNNFCAMCHGLFARSGGSIPDLRLSSSILSAEMEDIVLGGMQAPAGMPGFADVLSVTDLNQIRAYLHARAEEDRKTSLDASRVPRMTWLSDKIEEAH